MTTEKQEENTNDKKSSKKTTSWKLPSLFGGVLALALLAYALVPDRQQNLNSRGLEEQSPRGSLSSPNAVKFDQDGPRKISLPGNSNSTPSRSGAPRSNETTLQEPSDRSLNGSIEANRHPGRATPSDSRFDNSQPLQRWNTNPPGQAGGRAWPQGPKKEPTLQRSRLPSTSNQGSDYNAFSDIELQNQLSGQRTQGDEDARLARTSPSPLHLPSQREFGDLPDFNSKKNNVKSEQLKKATQPKKKVGALERKRKREKQLHEIKKQIGLPQPKKKLKKELYDPWAQEYEQVINKEEKELSSKAESALRARQEEEQKKRLRKK